MLWAHAPPADVRQYPFRLDLLREHRRRQQAAKVQPVPLQLAEGQALVVLQGPGPAGRQRRACAAKHTGPAAQRYGAQHAGQRASRSGFDAAQDSLLECAASGSGMRPAVRTRASRMRSTPLITDRTHGVVGRLWDCTHHNKDDSQGAKRVPKERCGARLQQARKPTVVSLFGTSGAIGRDHSVRRARHKTQTHLPLVFLASRQHTQAPSRDGSPAEAISYQAALERMPSSCQHTGSTSEQRRCRQGLRGSCRPCWRLPI